MSPTGASDGHAESGPALLVRTPDGRVQHFSGSFHIGRDADCDVQLQDPQVSRHHAHVSIVRGEWSIRDLQSSNGLFVNGSRVVVAPVGSGVTLTLGAGGPSLEIYPEHEEREDPPSGTGSSEDSLVLERYITSGGEEEDEPVGSRTVMLRRAFHKLQKKQTRRSRLAIAAIALVAIGAAGYAYYVHRWAAELQTMARDTFYQMKEYEVRLAAVEQQLGGSSPEARQMIRRLDEDRRAREEQYDRYAQRLYGRELGERDRLILRITRVFGECEIAAPERYMREVNNYIDKWLSTSRYRDGLERARRNGYINRILVELKARRLPKQFFYLALQESDFIPERIGPRTRWGIAKGMWQFIPPTGRAYGLATGPLSDERTFDAQDDRFDWMKSTNAAARYIRAIYDTDAAASGLLVIASYNWGEHRVIDRIKKMPEHPRERNFWKLLEHYGDSFPDETYKYVFYIVSAAVIGENPRLFGFDFDNPLPD